MIVKEFEHTQDGICVRHKLLATYIFWGDVALYIGQQQDVLQKHYTLLTQEVQLSLLMTMKRDGWD